MQKLNFEELNFRRILINLRMFEFELKIALTISSVVNKKRQYVAIMFIKIISELPYSPEKIFAKIIMPRGQRALIWMVTSSVVSKQPACTASLAALIEAESSVLDNRPFGSGNHLKYG